MTKAYIISASVIMCCIASTSSAQNSLAANFTQLDHSCWQTQITPTEIDMHCFSLTHDKNLAMDVHKVRDVSGQLTYEGVTVINLKPQSGPATYAYYGSTGYVLPGTIEDKGYDLVFYEKSEERTTLLTTWHFTKDSYTTQPKNGKPRIYTKVAPVVNFGF